MLRVEVRGSVSEFDAGEWDALVGERGSPFLEHAWLKSLEDAGCVGPRAGWVPTPLALIKDGCLVAAAPLYVKDNSEGEFVFDWSWADVAERVGVAYYPKLVFAVPFTPVTGARALVAEGEDRATAVAAFAEASRAIAKRVGASSVHVLFPHEDEAALWESAGLLRRVGFQYHFYRDGAESFDDYLARFNSKHRNQIKRESSQPAKDDVSIETVAPDAIDAALVRAMYRFYVSTVDRHFYGRRYLNARFFELVADRFRHRLAWVVARAGDSGKPIAGAFNVKKADRLYGRYWGAAVDLPFLHFNVCYYHGVRDTIRERLSVFEPGAGGEHKRARGFVPTLTHSAHHIADARLRRVIAPFLEREREKVLAYVNESSSEP